MCNAVATVALNFEVSFGACFMLTSNQPNVALVRDELQGIVRAWRRPALEPHNGAMGRGRDGRCIIYALLGCKAPMQLASSLKGRKKGEAISPIHFAEWLQTQHTKEMNELTTHAAEGMAMHGERGNAITRQTAECIAWNTVERKANTSQHFALFVHDCSLSTRGWRIRCMEDYRSQGGSAIFPPWLR